MKGLYVLPSMFKVQMWLLRFLGFKVVTVKALVEQMYANNDTDNLVALTFDDGYEDFYKNAMPILAQYRYPATVFVVSSLIGKTNEWDVSRYGGVVERLMDVQQLIEIKQMGVEIGSHSLSHKDLTLLDDDGLKTEIMGSKKQLEDLLQMPVETFCYPFGGCNQKVKDVVMVGHYKSGIGTKRGTVFLSDDLFDLRRIPVRLNTHPLLFIYKIVTAYEDKKGRGQRH